MKSRTGFFSLGALVGVILGASLTAYASPAEEVARYASRIATALERIAQAQDRGKAP